MMDQRAFLQGGELYRAPGRVQLQPETRRGRGGSRAGAAVGAAVLDHVEESIRDMLAAASVISKASPSELITLIIFLFFSSAAAAIDDVTRADRCLN